MWSGEYSFVDPGNMILTCYPVEVIITSGVDPVGLGRATMKTTMALTLDQTCR